MRLLKVQKHISHLSLGGAQIEIQLQERTQSTTNTCEPVQPVWKSRNNAHTVNSL